MARHLLRTGVQYAAVLLAAIVLNFALPRLAPGDAVDYLLPPEQAGALTPEQRSRVLDRFGLDDPVPEQFGRYLTGIARGDLLVSVRFGRPVTSLLRERIGWTLLLVGGALVLSTLIGAALGFRSAWRRGTRADTGTLGGGDVPGRAPSVLRRHDAPARLLGGARLVPELRRAPGR